MHAARTRWPRGRWRYGCKIKSIESRRSASGRSHGELENLLFFAGAERWMECFDEKIHHGVCRVVSVFEARQQLY